MFPLTEIADPKNPDRPRIINPANIDQIIPGDDGSVTVFFHGGSNWSIPDKKTAEDVYQSFRGEIARQRAFIEDQMRRGKSNIIGVR